MEIPKTVIVAAHQLEHVMQYKPNENGGYSFLGIEGKLLQIILATLNFGVKFVTPSDGQWGSVGPDGNWTGLFGMIQRNEADLAMSFLGVFPDTMSIVDYSTPYLHEPIKFLIGKPNTQSATIALLKTFDIPVWACLGLSLLILPLIFNVLLNEPIGKTFLQFVGNLVKQPTFIPVVSKKHAFLLAFWWFYALVISFSYSAAVLSFLSFPLEGKAIRNFKELAEAIREGSHKSLTLRGSSIDIKLKQQSIDTYYIGDMIEKNNWFFNIGHQLPKSEFKDTAIINLNFILQVSYGYLVPDYCISSDDYIEASFTAISMNKKFCCKRAVNRIISRMQSSGIFDKIIKDEMTFNWISQNHPHHEQSGQTSVSLQDVRGPFILLFGGYIAATLVLISEKLYFTFGKRSEKI
ncbi:glutamate receptor ionotropic, delta-1-like [Parasteatoda tepidariorum]|uniref:glutamate receptor ionotropic, delta-1-like n=1 Tax=Parasteatoda tepidariorum TaxID=114398 RepID=UPI0039BD7480